MQTTQASRSPSADPPPRRVLSCDNQRRLLSSGEGESERHPRALNPTIATRDGDHWKWGAAPRHISAVSISQRERINYIIHLSRIENAQKRERGPTHPNPPNRSHSPNFPKAPVGSPRFPEDLIVMGVRIFSGEIAPQPEGALSPPLTD